MQYAKTKLLVDVSGTESRHGLLQLQSRLQVCYMPLSLQLGETMCHSVTIQYSSEGKLTNAIYPLYSALDPWIGDDSGPE